MKNRTATLIPSILIAGIFMFGNVVSAQNASKEKPGFSGWPEASQKAAKEMMDKYGKPDVAGDELLVWMDKGKWKKITVSKEDTEHNFPIDHTDMLEQSVSYKVPADKFDDLAEFDGSVVVDRTQGLLSARCDMEANNLLALNLAHDVITEKKSVQQAREAYGAIIKEKMNGGDPEYMKKLTFEPQAKAADPGQNTTGLTKEEVMKKMKDKGKG